jgi:hypothetical protein
MRAALAVGLLLVASVADAATVRVAWSFDDSAKATCEDKTTPTAGNCPLTGFEIYEKGAGDVWGLVATVAPSARYKDFAASVGQVKCYRVLALSSLAAGGNVTRSTTVETCLPAIPEAPPKNPRGVSSLTISVKVIAQ